MERENEIAWRVISLLLTMYRGRFIYSHKYSAKTVLWVLAGTQQEMGDRSSGRREIVLGILYARNYDGNNIAKHTFAIPSIPLTPSPSPLPPPAASTILLLYLCK